MGSMITAYIDESGNMGCGGKYFVLAAAVFDTAKGLTRAKRIIRKEQQLLAKERNYDTIQEIKSCTLKFPERQRILNKLTAKPDIDIFYLVVDKTQVTLLQEQKPKNLVYNYFAKLLTDAIFQRYHGDFRIVFDQRSTAVKSMNSLTDYITINAYTTSNLVRHYVEVFQRDSKTEYNLQVADLIAGTVYKAYHRQQPHFLNLIKSRIVNLGEFPYSQFDGSLIRGADY